jgi:hypothetical protein
LEGVDTFLNLPHMLTRDSFPFNSTKVRAGGMETFLNLPHMLTRDYFPFNSTKVSAGGSGDFPQPATHAHQGLLPLQLH